MNCVRLIHIPLAFRQVRVTFVTVDVLPCHFRPFSLSRFLLKALGRLMDLYSCQTHMWIFYQFDLLVPFKWSSLGQIWSESSSNRRRIMKEVTYQRAAVGTKSSIQKNISINQMAHTLYVGLNCVRGLWVATNWNKLPELKIICCKNVGTLSWKP